MNGRRNGKKRRKNIKEEFYSITVNFFQKINLRTQITDLIKIYYSVIGP